MRKARILNEFTRKLRESSKCSAIAAPDQLRNGVRSSKGFFERAGFNLQSRNVKKVPDFFLPLHSDPKVQIYLGPG